MLNDNSSILALDVGGRRIGVASASVAARMPRPLTTLMNDDGFLKALQQIISDVNAKALVVGLPRGLDGQHTSQTVTVEAFIDNLKSSLTIPIYWQDEAVTSHKAEAELKRRGIAYKKGDIDALAATYILEDFINENPEMEL